MVYENESGSGETAETQLADNFEVQVESALSKKSSRLTSDQKKILEKTAESQVQKALEKKPTRDDWNSLDEAKSAIVAKKNTIENLNFSVESKKPSATSQDLPPVSTAINSLIISKEQQENTANITYDHIRSVFNEKTKESIESDQDSNQSSSNTTKKQNLFQLNNLSLQAISGVLVIAGSLIYLGISKSNDSTSLTQKGDDLFVQSKFSESLKFYDQALGVDNSLIGPRLKRAQIYYAKGDYARALADCEFVLSRIPSDHQALKQCALLSMLCKKNKRAMDCVQELLRLQYTEPKDLVVIIRVLAANHEHLRAIYFYEKFLQVNKDKVLAESLKNTIVYARKNANQYSYSNGLIELRKASISDPSRKIDYLQCMVEFAAKRKKYTDASNICSEILALDSGNAKAGMKSLWFKYLLMSPNINSANGTVAKNTQRPNAKLTALKSKAFDAFEKGDYYSTSDALTQAIQINPQDSDLKKFLSYVLLKATILDRVTAYQNLRQASLDELITLMRSLCDSRQTKLAGKVALYATQKYPREASSNLEIQKTLEYK
jgi:tetratricopeptide (TPR) repeat protein